jgi:hypothetical protein
MSAKTSTEWSWTIVTNGLQVAAFVAWKGYDIEQAGNVLLFLVWLVAVIGIASLFTHSSKPAAPPAPKSRWTIGFATAISTCAALVWFGYFVTASFYLIGIGALTLQRGIAKGEIRP